MFNKEKSYSFVVENNCKVSVLFDVTSSLDLNIVVKDNGDLKIAILNKKNKNKVINNQLVTQIKTSLVPSQTQNRPVQPRSVQRPNLQQKQDE